MAQEDVVPRPIYCTKCRKVFKKGTTTKFALERYWHPRCFCCAHCNKPFTDTFCRFNDNPYHPDCLSYCFERGAAEEPEVETAMLDGVEIAPIPGKGNGLVATRDLPAGFLFLVDPAFVFCPDNAGTRTSLLPELLRQLAEHPEHYPAVQALCPSPSEMTTLPTIEFTQELLDLVPSFITPPQLQHLYWVQRRNAHGVADSDGHEGRTLREGSGLFATASYINHSCYANSSRFFRARTLYLRTNRAISKGEELTDTYVPLYWPQHMRQARLEAYMFKCTCERCVVEVGTPEWDKENLMEAIRCPVPDCSSTLLHVPGVFPEAGLSVPGETIIPCSRVGCSGSMTADNARDKVLDLNDRIDAIGSQARSGIVAQSKGPLNSLFVEIDGFLGQYHWLRAFAIRIRNSIGRALNDRDELEGGAVDAVDGAKLLLPLYHPPVATLHMDAAFACADERSAEHVNAAFNILRICYGATKEFFQARFHSEISRINAAVSANCPRAPKPWHLLPTLSVSNPLLANNKCRNVSDEIGAGSVSGESEPGERNKENEASTGKKSRRRRRKAGTSGSKNTENAAADQCTETSPESVDDCPVADAQVPRDATEESHQSDRPTLVEFGVQVDTIGLCGPFDAAIHPTAVITTPRTCPHCSGAVP